ncbi:MAG: hypothetical protein EZS28_005897 [Streblomastix strix]|uniref:Uncharacterized protein n=1 Tax=Streblomastix strix TaxID=222440 RepID=A0A5J4WVQ5_9EUKA|nr:MAG: hypothetical protein EZS28_005897 [Streblomastix strix]
MSQTQTTGNSQSQFDYSCQLQDLDDSSNFSVQENAAELNMLSTATEALNQEDSTEFSNSNAIFAHQQSSEKHTPKRTEHGNGDVAHKKQSADCCTDNYLQTSLTSLIAQRKFQNNMIRLNASDIQQVMRLKPNYLKFSIAQAIHIVEPFTFVISIPLACHSVTCIHFTHNCSLHKNDITSYPMNLMINIPRFKLIQFKWNTTTKHNQHI